MNLYQSITVALVLGLLLGGCASPGTHNSDQLHHPGLQNGQVLEQWGVEVLGVSVTAAGHFLDMRYRVLDPGKAQSLADSKKEAYILDTLTNAKLSVADTPTAGKLRERGRKLMPGRVYSIIFANPGMRITSGMKVTLVVGDLTLENVVVQ